MASGRNQKTLHDYLEGGSSNLKWESFRKRFSDYLAVHFLQDKVQASQMKAFFEIADEHLREQSGLRAVNKNKRPLLQDHRRCEKFMLETEKRVEKLKAFFRASGKKRGSFTPGLARSFADETAAFQERLTDLFFDEKLMMEVEKSLLSKQSLKIAEREFTIDLLTFIADEFPGFSNGERDALIGATLAGAGFFSENELRDDPGPRIPMKVSRAKKHLEDFYRKPGVERVYPAAVVGKKKKQR